MDVAMKQWTTEEDGFLDQTTTINTLRPRHHPYTDKPNGNCTIESSSDAAVDSPLTRRPTAAAAGGGAVTPSIPAHHHLYWQATGARRHGNAAASPVSVDC